MIRNPSSTKKPAPVPTAAMPAWVSWVTWGIAILMLALMLFLLLRRAQVVLSASAAPAGEAPAKAELIPPQSSEDAALPAFEPNTGVSSLIRNTNTHTIIPTRSRTGVVQYTVEKGDSIFGIAHKFGLKPETILWANFEQLNDDPHMISVGLNLNVPAVDGVLYKWKEGDTVESVAAQLHAKPEDILNWPGNKLDVTNPVIEPGRMIMVPGGSREFKQWVVPVAYAPKSGVNKGISGPGGCDIAAGGAVGSGSFVWPAANHSLSGNDYWSGHLAIDIAAGTGAPVYAADNGVVVYAGPIGGGYGNMVMIDHNNGYHTLYAHLSQISVYCGQSVYQGNLIGLAGSTGNSTGPHLHFEVRYLGGFINPWYVLP